MFSITNSTTGFAALFEQTKRSSHRIELGFLKIFSVFHKGSIVKLLFSTSSLVYYEANQGFFGKYIFFPSIFASMGFLTA